MIYDDLLVFNKEYNIAYGQEHDVCNICGDKNKKGQLTGHKILKLKKNSLENIIICDTCLKKINELISE